MRRLLIVLAAGATTLGASSLRAQTTPAACEPRTAGSGLPAVSEAFRPTWLVGEWRLTVWVTGRGVSDTVIAGNLTLFPSQLDSANKAFERVVPIIGHSDIALEYVPGIEPFSTPALSRSTSAPGVELRIDADGPRLVFGNPTQIAYAPVVSLAVPYSATFYLFTAFTHEFSGQWRVSRGGTDRPWGGFCAVRITPG